jgi:hypothetical protein
VSQEECERVWGWRLTLPSKFPLWELEFWWTPKPSKNNCRGQNTSHRGVFYIIGKLLKRRCLKWARMTHLNICHTSYGKKKDRESNWQFDSWPRKVKNWPDFRACWWSATHCWKALNESYNFASDFVPIENLNVKLWPHKVARVPTLVILGLPFGSPGTKKPFGCSPCGELQNILHGGRWWFPPNPGRGESYESEVARGLSLHQRCSNIVLTIMLVGWMQIQVNN